MRSETNGLRAPTTTSPVGSEICNTRVFTRTQTEEQKREKKPTQKSSCSLRGGHFPGAQLSVLSLRYHDRVGQEPATGAHPSVDVFWESVRSHRASDLLRAGWDPVHVRHHPDGALLQNQDPQCQGDRS